MNTNFEEIKQHCLETSRISEKVIDKFLVDFAAKRIGVHELMDHYLKKYKHVVREMPEDFFPRVIAEYIIGKTFMQNGNIHKYLDHPGIKALDQESGEFLKYQSLHPWRYCFARIIDHPEKEFFQFYDEFLDEEFLLYSPGVEAYCESGHKNSLYLMLIGFNGECWQSYGVMFPFRSFDADDIYFYGTEISAKVESDETLMESVYHNPMPYFMLGRGMEYPITVSQGHVTRMYVANDSIGEIDTNTLEEDFTIEWNKGIYRFVDEDLFNHPHYAKAYYDEKRGELQRFAMTEFGFKELSNILISCGLKVKEGEDYSVGISMLTTMNHILRRDAAVDEYEKLFPSKTESKIDDETLSRINQFIQKLLPYINTGQKPDIKKLAQQCDLDYENAQGIYAQLKDSIPNKL